MSRKMLNLPWIQYTKELTSMNRLPEICPRQSQADRFISEELMEFPWRYWAPKEPVSKARKEELEERVDLKLARLAVKLRGGMTFLQIEEMRCLLARLSRSDIIENEPILVVLEEFMEKNILQTEGEERHVMAAASQLGLEVYLIRQNTL